MNKKSERVLQMKQNFMRLHNEGKTILEISEIFGLSRTTIYSLLLEIADENGVTRASLLEVVHPPHNMTVVSKRATAIKVEELKTSFATVYDELDSISNTIKETIEMYEGEER